MKPAVQQTGVRQAVPVVTARKKKKNFFSQGPSIDL
jgi:hypothetical protein